MGTTSRADLAAVHERLAELSELVLAAIRDATAALNEADRELAEHALASAEKIARLADQIDQLAMDAPTSVALSPRDMQTLLCYSHTSLRLARMGDFARLIADIARSHCPDRVAPEGLEASFVQMAAQVVEAARLVVRLVRGEDLQLVNSLVEDDEWTDVLQRAAFAAVESPEWGGGAGRAVYVILVARYLERFGDQAVFIAKRISALRERVALADMGPVSR